MMLFWDAWDADVWVSDPTFQIRRAIHTQLTMTGKSFWRGASGVEMIMDTQNAISSK